MFKKAKGFTLIELLIVVAIIGILAALLIPNAMTAMQKAKQKGTMKDIATISTALADYVTDHGSAPTQNGDIDTTFVGFISPFYVRICPINDQWGFPFKVSSGLASGTIRGCVFSGVDDFLVQSYGRNGTIDGPEYTEATPESGMYIVETMPDFAKDLVEFNGSWVVGPQTRQ
jgi:type II secretion system protein G